MPTAPIWRAPWHVLATDLRCSGEVRQMFRNWHSPTIERGKASRVCPRVQTSTCRARPSPGTALCPRFRAPTSAVPLTAHRRICYDALADDRSRVGGGGGPPAEPMVRRTLRWRKTDSNSRFHLERNSCGGAPGNGRRLDLTLRASVNSLEAFQTPASEHPITPVPGRRPKTLHDSRPSRPHPGATRFDP